MCNISVYLNPKASQSLHNFNIDDIKKYFFRHTLVFNTPSSQEELIRLVKENRDMGVDCIFSIGGDGTAHSIAQHLVGSKTKLFVLPGGTANDFADEVGTMGGLKKLANIFHAQTTRKVDLIKVNDRYLISNGGIGIAQEIASLVDKSRNSSNLFKKFTKFAGKNTYSAVFLKHILTSKFKLHNVFLESPDFPLLDKKVVSPMILINNQPKLAGKYPIAPETRNNDGKFNVSIFLHDNKLDFLKCVASILMGEVPVDKNLVQFETDSLKMISLDEQPLTFFGDGEQWEPAMELNYEVVGNGLEVFSKGEDILLCGYSLDEVSSIG